jgi:hypothetical protein
MNTNTVGVKVTAVLVTNTLIALIRIAALYTTAGILALLVARV